MALSTLALALDAGDIGGCDVGFVLVVSGVVTCAAWDPRYMCHIRAHLCGLPCCSLIYKSSSHAERTNSPHGLCMATKVPKAVEEARVCYLLQPHRMRFYILRLPTPCFRLIGVVRVCPINPRHVPRNACDAPISCTPLQSVSTTSQRDRFLELWMILAQRSNKFGTCYIQCGYC